MARKEIKYLLKNPLVYLGMVIISFIIIFNVGVYTDLYKNTTKTEEQQYADLGIVDGFIPTTFKDQKEQVIQRIYQSLIEDYQVSPENAQDIVNDLKELNSQEEIEKCILQRYDMPGVKNLFEEYSAKKATIDEMKIYLDKLFEKEKYVESLSYKYIDFLGISLIYFSIIVFVFIFSRDMKKDIYSLLHTKPISARTYILTKLFSGLIPLYMYSIIATIVFDIVANIVSHKYGFTGEWVSVWIKLVLLILPNILMIGTFFIFITICFKSVLPTLPALLVYATYSNMGRMLEDGYRYVPNPLAIVVRFPNELTKNYLPKEVIFNQILLCIIAVVLLFVSIHLWEKKKG